MFEKEIFMKMLAGQDLTVLISFAFGAVFGGTLLGLSVNKILKLMVRGYM